MDGSEKTAPDAPLVIVVDEAHALIGGMTGQGKSLAMRKAVADLLHKGRATGMPIVVGTPKTTTP
ncbi:hypothetical protein [Nonomuraea turcica]|uniref:hypothetical protein n=1 Tax=Nonomuraea sp. G32 TaxID=3067274 RepID=UPI00273B6ADD|nr:hypothetical protein [Nonomuraea sp. G32]MDP4501124.1 hypothetical protein [Nonomuraea sp. G32]